jgi:hypothetical protein
VAVEVREHFAVRAERDGAHVLAGATAHGAREAVKDRVAVAVRPVVEVAGGLDRKVAHAGVVSK